MWFEEPFSEDELEDAAAQLIAESAADRTDHAVCERAELIRWKAKLKDWLTVTAKAGPVELGQVKTFIARSRAREDGLV